MIFKLGELFCGPGGLALAAKISRFNYKSEEFAITHAWATDYNPDSCHTYINNICPKQPTTVLCEDVRYLDMGKLKKISGIDALAFGFPCNDYSVVGKQKGFNGNFGPLYKYGVDALKLFRPKWFLAENVGGLRNTNSGSALKKILNDLHNAEYSVYPNLYKFNEYGIPQIRQRIIIVGIRKDVGIEFKVPSKTAYQGIDISVKNAIENPPISTDVPNNEFTKHSSKVISRLKYIKPGENAFNAKIPQEYQLNVRGAKISQIYKRLDPSKPSYTITGSGGGGTHVYHWVYDRALTNRERARLQSFPDNFVFCGSKESVRKQIGMAVPPMGAKVIFQAILMCFAGKTYESIPCSISPLVFK